jgi:hypothetical protein
MFMIEVHRKSTARRKIIPKKLEKGIRLKRNLVENLSS